MPPLRILALLLLFQPRPGLPAESAEIGTWVWHFDPALGAESAAAYRDLLVALPRNVAVFVSVENECDADRFESETAHSGELDSRVRFVVTGKEVSAWARDRYVLLAGAAGPRALLPLRLSVETERLGELEVPVLLRGLIPGLEVVRTALAFEGGNVLISADDVIVGYDVIRDTVELTGVTAGEARARLARVFERRRVTVIGDEGMPAPHEHVDMFLTIVGPRQVLLGDPVAGDDNELDGFGRQDRDPELLRLYARVRETLLRAGYRVERIPIVHLEGGGVITWNNAVIEGKGPRRTAYVPSYGLETFDRAARLRYAAHGFRVMPIRARGVIRAGGAVRCLSNTLAR
jgi:hypothetical protein